MSLTCPRCALEHTDLDERFCRDCGMPLVYTGEREQGPITDAHEKARKVRPQFARGELVKVTGGRNQADAEFVQNILLEHGIPSILRRTRGDLHRPFRVPAVPWVPVLAILSCIWLMVNLSIDTWVRFVVWLIIGFAVYFTYGYRSSRLGRGLKQADADGDVPTVG